MAEALKSPYSAKPSQLAAPVPTTDQKEDLLSGLDIKPTAPNAPALEQQPGADLGVSSNVAGTDTQAIEKENNAQAAGLRPALPIEPTPEGTDMQSGADYLTRAIGGLTVTDRELQNYLQNKYGENNVKRTSDGLLFRASEKEKFKRYDPAFVNSVAEAVKDIILDNSRVFGETLVQGVMSKFGGAVGGASANMAGNLAQGLVGVPPDPSRNLPLELGVSTALGGMIPASAQAARTVVSGEVAPALRKFATHTPEFVESQIAKAQADAQLVNGLLNRNVPAGVITEAVPAASEELRMLAKNKPEVANSLLDYGKSLGEAYDSLFNFIGNKSGERRIGQEFTATPEILRKAEGAVIGQYRQIARDAAKGAPQPMQALSQSVHDVLQEFGAEVIPATTKKIGNIQAGEVPKTVEVAAQIKFPPANEIQQKLGLASIAQANTILNQVKDVSNMLMKSQGKMSLEQVEQAYKGLGRILDNASYTDAPVFNYIGRMKKALTQDWDNALDHYAGNINGYQDAKANYRLVKDGIENLSGLLKKDNVTKEYLTKYIFDSPSDALSRMQSVRAILKQSDNPDLWSDIVYTKLMNTAESAKVPLRPEFRDWSKILTDYSKLPNEVKSEMFKGMEKDRGIYEAMIRTGARLQNVSPQELLNSRSMQNKVATQVAQVLQPSGFISQKINTVGDWLSSLGKGKAVAAYLNEGGIEDVLKRFPPSKRGIIRTVLTGAIDYGFTEKPFRNLGSSVLRQTGVKAADKISNQMTQ